ncbi:response regulator [bacterium]|nr:response regulator [bacterium]
MPRVLIVEDDRELRQVLSYSLMDIGAECVEATDGRKALEILCQSLAPEEQFQLVLLDILMPGGVSGWDVLEAMRANPLWSDIPAVVLSGKATLLAEQERARKLRAAHLQKTARFVDEVMAKAREVLGLGDDATA